LSASGPGWFIFDLKTNWKKARLRSRRNLSFGERENGASGEQNVPYVFFAGCGIKWPTTEILSTASEHLKTIEKC